MLHNKVQGSSLKAQEVLLVFQHLYKKTKQHQLLRRILAATFELVHVLAGEK